MEVEAKKPCPYSFAQPQMGLPQYFVFTKKVAGVKGQGEMGLGYAKEGLGHY